LQADDGGVPNQTTPSPCHQIHDETVETRGTVDEEVFPAQLELEGGVGGVEDVVHGSIPLLDEGEHVNDPPRGGHVVMVVDDETPTIRVV